MIYLLIDLFIHIHSFINAAVLAALAFLALRPNKGWLRRSRAIAPRGKAPPLGASAPGKQQRRDHPSLDSIYREAMDKDDLSSCASPATTATGTGSATTATGTGSGSLGSGAGGRGRSSGAGGGAMRAGSGAGGGRRDPVLDFIASNLDSMRQRAAGSCGDRLLCPPGPPLAEGAGPAGGGSGQLDSLASRGMSQRSSQLSAEIQQWEVGRGEGGGAGHGVLQGWWLGS